MVVTRRFVVLLALMVWQGGFMFYGAFTVPVTRVQLHEKHVQPFRSEITRHVTKWMNLVGTIAILAMFVDVKAGPRTGQKWRWIGWTMMALPHPILVWLHFFLSSRMDAPGFHDTDMRSFAPWHRVYLMINTFQWLGGMLFAVCSLRVWQREDQDAVQAHSGNGTGA